MPPATTPDPQTAPAAVAPRHNPTFFLGPVVVTLIAALTAILVILGPAPAPAIGSTAVRDVDRALIKPTDRFVLIS
jgi:hypothetical protein